MAIVIEGARLIDGTGKPPLDNAVVVIDGKRVVAVDEAGRAPAPEDSVVVDAGGRTLLPALTDAHVAMISFLEEEKPYGITDRTIASTVLRGAAAGRRLLNGGVTTVRVDTGGHHGIFALRDAFNSGVLEGPRMIVPGRAICMTGGHGWRGHAIEADGADGIRRAARYELKAGADWIKLMATGGAGTPTERVDDVQMTLEELKAGVEEAHKKGKHAFAHVSCAEGARLCIAAGIDSIEHGLFLEEDIVLAMKEKGIFLVPTLGVYRQAVERGRQGLVPEYLYRKALQVVDRHAQSFRMALEAGVKIAAGTDSGYPPYPAGDGLIYEMELMHQEGMPPMEALISATRRAAECLRLDGDLGTIEPGKLADLLIVDGDPLADIASLRRVWMVLKEGRVVFSRRSSPSRDHVKDREV